jgi:hypothetical protein
MDFTPLKKYPNAKALATRLVEDVCDIPFRWLNRDVMIAEVADEIKIFDWDDWTRVCKAVVVYDKAVQAGNPPAISDSNVLRSRMAHVPEGDFKDGNCAAFLTDVDSMNKFLPKLATKLGLDINLYLYTDTGKWDHDMDFIYDAIEKFVSTMPK